MLNCIDDSVYIEADRLMREKYALARAAGKLSEVHDESHVNTVSDTGTVVVRGLSIAQGITDNVEEAMRIAAVTGKVHDIVRGATEKSRHGPDGATFLETLRDKHPWNTLSDRDFDLMVTVTSEHEGSFPRVLELYGEPFGSRPQVYESMVAHGVITGDRIIEGSGHRIIERRIRFVGRERMLNGGDLQEAGFVFPEDSVLAVLGECQMRLYKKNTLEDVPSWLVKHAQGLHAKQYIFYAGLLKFLGYSEVSAAKYLAKRGFTGMDDELIEKIRNEHHLTGEIFDDRYPILAEAVHEIDGSPGYVQIYSDDMLSSAGHLVNLLVSAETPEEANDTILSYGTGYEITHPFLHDLLTGIKAYKEGDPKMYAILESDVIEGARAYMKTL